MTAYAGRDTRTEKVFIDKFTQPFLCLGSTVPVWKTHLPRIQKLLREARKTGCSKSRRLHRPSFFHFLFPRKSMSSKLTMPSSSFELLKWANLVSIASAQVSSSKLRDIIHSYVLYHYSTFFGDLGPDFSLKVFSFSHPKLFESFLIFDFSKIMLYFL